jgi:hypothetical protein
MTTNDAPDQPASPDAVVELAAYVRRLEAERQAERDPLRRKSLGLQIFTLKGELMRHWRRRERAE